MADHPQLQAEPRELTGKKSGRLRRQGVLPATVYGFQMEPRNIQMSAHDFASVLRRAGRTQVLDLCIGTASPVPVLIRETQVDPKKNQIIHVEFYRPNMRANVQTRVPVHFVGESPAVQEGGIFLPVLDHLDIESLPDSVPAAGIEVDISSIAEINGALHVGDVTAPAGVTILTPADEVLAKVNPPVAEEVLEEAVEATEPLPTELGGDETPPDAVPEA
jgi:large subunit ribosomal protein L25